MAASLNHPNVIPIYDSGPVDDLLYISMRYVSGADLRRVLKATGRLAPEMALPLIAQTGRALDAAHRAGLVHRDVKPGNILIERGGEDEPDHVYLADFGITKHALSISGLTATGHFVEHSTTSRPSRSRVKRWTREQISTPWAVSSTRASRDVCPSRRTSMRRSSGRTSRRCRIVPARSARSFHRRSTMSSCVHSPRSRASASSPVGSSSLRPRTPSDHQSRGRWWARSPTCRRRWSQRRRTSDPRAKIRTRRFHPSLTAPRLFTGSCRRNRLILGDSGGDSVPPDQRRRSGSRRPLPHPVLWALAVALIIAGGVAWVVSSGGGTASPVKAASRPAGHTSSTMATSHASTPASRRSSMPAGSMTTTSTTAAASHSSGAATALIQAAATANANDYSHGLLPPASCVAHGGSMLTCKDPTRTVSNVTFQTFPSLQRLYTVYTARFRSLSGGPFKANFKDCTEAQSYGEVSWNHASHHSRRYSLERARVRSRKRQSGVWSSLLHVLAHWKLLHRLDRQSWPTPWRGHRRPSRLDLGLVAQDPSHVLAVQWRRHEHGWVNR